MKESNQLILIRIFSLLFGSILAIIFFIFSCLAYTIFIMMVTIFMVTITFILLPEKKEWKLILEILDENGITEKEYEISASYTEYETDWIKVKCDKKIKTNEPWNVTYDRCYIWVDKQTRKIKKDIPDWEDEQ